MTVRCLPSGTQVQLFLPGQTQAAASYTFTVDGSGNPVQPTPGVQVIQAPTDQLFVNTGRNFFNGYDYLYDPIGGFVGYRLNGTAGTNAVAHPAAGAAGQPGAAERLRRDLPDLPDGPGDLAADRLGHLQRRHLRTGQPDAEQRHGHAGAAPTAMPAAPS